MYVVPEHEAVAVGLLGKFGVGLLLGWSVPGWVALFGGLKILAFIMKSM